MLLMWLPPALFVLNKSGLTGLIRRAYACSRLAGKVCLFTYFSEVFAAALCPRTLPRRASLLLPGTASAEPRRWGLGFGSSTQDLRRWPAPACGEVGGVQARPELSVLSSTMRIMLDTRSTVWSSSKLRNCLRLEC